MIVLEFIGWFVSGSVFTIFVIGWALGDDYQRLMVAERICTDELEQHKHEPFVAGCSRCEMLDDWKKAVEECK